MIILHEASYHLCYQNHCNMWHVHVDLDETRRIKL